MVTDYEREAEMLQAWATHRHDWRIYNPTQRVYVCSCGLERERDLRGEMVRPQVLTDHESMLR